MTDHHFHDGVFHAANRTNEASGRSWHIPVDRAQARRRGWYVWLAVQLVVCAIPVLLIAMVWS